MYHRSITWGYICIFLYIFLLERRPVMDFFLLNYWQNESRVSVVASRILGYKFNNDSVELICGANQVSNLTYKALVDR